MNPTCYDCEVQSTCFSSGVGFKLIRTLVVAFSLLPRQMVESSYNKEIEAIGVGKEEVFSFIDEIKSKCHFYMSFED